MWNYSLLLQVIRTLTITVQQEEQVYLTAKGPLALLIIVYPVRNYPYWTYLDN